jgi:hypothetical protein
LCLHCEKQLREIPLFEFENWAVIALGGIPNKAQVGDMVDSGFRQNDTPPTSWRL